MQRDASASVLATPARVPVRIHFSGMAPSQQAAAAARWRAGLAARQHRGVLAWQVSVHGMTDLAARSTCGYRVRVQAALPGQGLAGASSHGTDLLSVLRDAFDAIEGTLAAAAGCNDNGDSDAGADGYSIQFPAANFTGGASASKLTPCGF